MNERNRKTAVCIITLKTKYNTHINNKPVATVLLLFWKIG